MKIDNLKSKQTEAKSSIKRSSSGSSASFFSLLDGQLQPTEQPLSIQPTTQSETCSIPAQLRLDGVFLSENTIDLLESFSNCLDNLELSTDDLTPIINALEDGTTSLLDIKEQLPADDPLAVLIDRVATISIIETEKFRRGDYN